MKKILSVFLAVLMILAIIPVFGITTFAKTSAQPPKISLTSNKTDVKVGDIITLTASVPKNSKLCTLTYVLNFNSQNFSLVESSVKMNKLFAMESTNTSTPGRVAYGGITSEQISDEGGVVFTLQLKVLKLPGTITATVKEAYENNGKNPEINVTSDYSQYSTKSLSFSATGSTEPESSYNIDIKQPDSTTVKYRNSVVLYAEAAKGIPAGGRVEWTADNGNFEIVSPTNSKELKITSMKKGNTTFTVTLYDAKGKSVASDSIEMKSKVGFFDKLIWFFRDLFSRKA